MQSIGHRECRADWYRRIWQAAMWAAPTRLLLSAGVFWLIGAVLLSLSATVLPPMVDGLYAPEPGPPPFQWTSSRVVVPIRGRTGPTHVVLELHVALEHERQPIPVALTTDSGAAATLPVTNTIRRYHLWIPPDT